MTVIVATTDE